MTPTRNELKSIYIRDHVTSLGDLPTINPSLASLLSGLRNFDVSERLTVGKWRAGGGYADVYEGVLELIKRDIGGKDGKVKVAVKRFRALMDANSGTAGVC